ncbi:MAG: methionine-S-sulfoxide reductase [Sneathiella sp.]
MRESADEVISKKRSAKTMVKSLYSISIILVGLIFSPIASYASSLEVATFAGGCFWCVEKDFEHVKGVKSAVSGYTGGMLQNPSYRDHGQHLEAVRITFDPNIVTYSQLLETFWRSVDPTDEGGQFCDRGNTYTTAIFANTEEQRKLAQASKDALSQSGILKAPIVTPVRNAAHWTDAEDYHQDYYKKNPVRYFLYRQGCRRDDRISELWGEQAHQGIDK